MGKWSLFYFFSLKDFHHLDEKLIFVRIIYSGNLKKKKIEIIYFVVLIKKNNIFGWLFLVEGIFFFNEIKC